MSSKLYLGINPIGFSRCKHTRMSYDLNYRDDGTNFYILDIYFQKEHGCSRSPAGNELLEY